MDKLSIGIANCIGIAVGYAVGQKIQKNSSDNYGENVFTGKVRTQEYSNTQLKMMLKAVRNGKEKYNEDDDFDSAPLDNPFAMDDIRTLETKFSHALAKPNSNVEVELSDRERLFMYDSILTF